MITKEYKNMRNKIEALVERVFGDDEEYFSVCLEDIFKKYEKKVKK